MKTTIAFLALLVALTGCSMQDDDFEMGDVNMDHRVAVDDAELVLESMTSCMTLEIVLCTTLTGQAYALADVNLDERITPGDASLILAKAGGSAPVEDRIQELEDLIAERLE